MVSAAEQGMPVSDLELIRTGNNYIFADRANSRVYRVSVLARDEESLMLENQRISSLASAGAPLLPPVVDAPLTLPDGDLATIWPLGGPPEPDPAVSIGPVLSALHLVKPVDDLEVWSGFERADRRIERAIDYGVPDHLISTVAGRLGELKENFPVWTTETVVHGDPHTGNVVLTDDGHRLIDLDDLALGCPEIDLATLYTAYRRFSRIAGTWDRFASSYQHPIDETLLDAFSTLRQLTMIAWLLSLWNLREESRDEAVHRVKTLDSTDEWNPL